MSAGVPSSPLPKFLMKTLIFSLRPSLKSTTRSLCSPLVPAVRRLSSGCRFHPSSTGGTWAAGSREEDPSLELFVKTFPIAVTQDALLDFVNGKKKATDAAHSYIEGKNCKPIRPIDQIIVVWYEGNRVWKNIIHEGDTVVDATCGNGYDTVALLKLIAVGPSRGCVYGLDIQNSALENTSYLLRETVNEDQWQLVKLSLLCHSRMEEIVPKDIPVRLIAFNLGYLPGGNKAIITEPNTTSSALQAACRILMPGGLISLVVYVGHLGGREELETILSFASNLAIESWSSFKFETLNRPNGPVLVFIIRKQSHAANVI